VVTVSDDTERAPAAERYTRRLNVQISAEDEAALKIANASDRVTTAARIRAMLSLWRDDGTYAQTVDRRVRQLDGTGGGEPLEAVPADAAGDPGDRRVNGADRLTGVSQLASGVAHEFNNLLAVILNSTALVAEKVVTLADAGDHQQWELALDDVEQIRLAGERAAALTRQLLTYGRREVIAPRVINLNEVVTDVEDILRRTIGDYVEVVISLYADLWPVNADPGQLGQVLLSLVADARVAIPAGGVLTVDTANLTVDEDYSADRLGVQLGRMVRLRIGATGAGLPADAQKHVFDPFFSGKPGGPASSFGLPAIHALVTAAGGHIQLYSQPGMGTTFTILLPATERTAAASEQASPLIAPPGQTVLLVEDGEALRRLTERMLSRNGYHVIAAANGTDAIQAAHDYDGEIHLLLTDVVMPHVQGKVVAARIRTGRPNIAVLYMSGYPQPILAYEGCLDPGVTVLEKPFSEADLLSKAGKVLGNFAGFTTVEPQRL
jgi:signal transduction histidine kinase/CheY-like chemotaxis protein